MSIIVVGVDGSAGSRQALRWALEEARLRGATLRVVHAWMTPLVEAMPEPYAIGLPPLPGPGPEQLAETFRQRAERVLEDTLREELGEGAEGVQVERRVVEGRAAQALVEAAAGADLLVVGSRGHGGFAGLLLGSVSQQCAHHAPCPVVIVPAPPPRPPAP